MLSIISAHRSELTKRAEASNKKESKTETLKLFQRPRVSENISRGIIPVEISIIPTI